jgi:hypothetical protein
MTVAHRKTTWVCDHASRIRRVERKISPQVRVTLSDDLLSHLRTEAKSKHVPLRWLVAGLVCDTMRGEYEAPRSSCAQTR